MGKKAQERRDKRREAKKERIEIRQKGRTERTEERQENKTERKLSTNEKKVANTAAKRQAEIVAYQNGFNPTADRWNGIQGVTNDALGAALSFMNPLSYVSSSNLKVAPKDAAKTAALSDSNSFTIVGVFAAVVLLLVLMFGGGRAR